MSSARYGIDGAYLSGSVSRGVVRSASSRGSFPEGSNVENFAFRFVGRAGEPAVAGAGLGKSSPGPELLADSLGGGRRVSERPGPLGLEYGDPAEEYPGPAQGRGRQREAAGEANQLRERSVAGLS